MYLYYNTAMHYSYQGMRAIYLAIACNNVHHSLAQVLCYYNTVMLTTAYYLTDTNDSVTTTQNMERAFECHNTI